MNIFQKLIKQIFRLSPILMGVGMVFFGVGEALGQTQTISTTGSGSFTVPAGVTSITIEVWGAGGRGGSRASGNDAAAGGGGGAYSRSTLTVTPGQIIPYFVGSGSTTEDPGEDSWFQNSTTVMAKGGNTVPTDGVVGATGGSASAGFGAVKFSGGNGANLISGNGGGGGSSAGIAANGNTATNQTGASSPFSGGAGGNGATSAGPGGNGAFPGGGGGGGKRQGASQPVQPGGTGGNGQIRISYIQLTSATGTDNQSVCNGDPIISTSYSIPVPASSVSPNLVISGLPAGLTSSFNSTTNTITISGTPTASGTYTISTRPTYLSSVPVTLTRSGTVTILPKPVVNNMTSTVCSGSGFTVTPVNGTNGVVPAGTTYSWTAPAVTGGMTGGTSGTNATSITGTLINPTNVVQTATYTVTPTTGSCVGTPFTVTVTVNPTPAISTMNAAVCTGSSFSLTPINLTNGIVPAGTTYSWSLPTVTGGMTGGATGSGASNISGTLTNTTSSPQTATYTVTPVSGSCTGTPFTVTITVAPNNSASAASTSPEVCINNAIPSITHTTTGATGIGAATGLPAGVSANWSGNTITISGTPTVSGVFNYTIPLTGGCGAVNATGTITVNANNTVSGPSSTPTLCVNTPLPNITHSTTGATGISNAGVSGANGLPTGVSAIWSAGIITISGTPTQAGTFNYSIPLSGGCSALFAVGTITVNPATEFTGQNMADQRICDGQNFSTLSVTATGTGTLSYQWFSNDNPNKTGAVPVGTNSNSFTPPSNAIGTKYYYVEVTGGCSVATSSFSRATVEPITVISAQPDNSGDVECFGDGFEPLSVTAQGADLTYQWYSVNTPVNTGGTAISGATSSSFTPPSNVATFVPFFYYVVVSGYCSSQTSDVSGEYLVTPPITTITEDPSTDPQTVCLGDAFSPITVQAIGEGIVSYQWYSNTTNSNTGGTLIPGATNPTFTPPSNTVGTLYYYATGSSDCGTVPSAVSGAFTVTPPTQIQTENLASQTICDGDSFAPISVNAIGTGAITYQWYSNTTASTTGGTLITGANSSSFTPPATAPGTTRYYYVVVGSNCGPNVTSNISGALTVNPITTIPTHPSTSSQTVCPGAPFSAISVSATGPGTLTYQWYSNSSNSNSGGTPISGATNASFTPPSATTGTTYYYVEVTSACETITSNVSGAFNVNQNTQINAQNTGAQSVCIGSPFSPISVTAIGTGTLTYQWYSNSTNSNSGGTPIGGATSSSFTPPSSVAGTTYYYVVVGSDCGPNVPSAVSGAFLVNPEPVPTFTNAPGATVCEQGTTTYTTQSGKSNYIWSISGTAGTDYSITSGGVGTSSSTVSIQWLTTGSKTVTVRYTEPTTGCIASTAVSSTTTVEPFATVGPPSVSFPSVCISSPNLSPFTRPTIGVTGIANSGVPGANGLPPGISASFNSGTGLITFSGTATTPGFYTYSIPLTGNCINGLTATGTIDVSPNYVLISVSSVSATSSGGSATVTINGDPALLSNGNYEVTYLLDDGTTVVEHTSSSFGVSGGRGSFSTVPLTNINVDVFKLTIKSIKKVTDVCPVPLNVNDTKNITFFSVCGATITSNRTFTVPAGIFEITILATGAGATGQTSQITIPVVPGEPLGVFIGQSAGTGAARNTYVTRDSSSPTPATSSIIYVNGGGGAGPNGQVSISYSCPDANKFDCIEVIDDGAISGTTVIRFTCDDTWQIPEGLVTFSVFAVGGGGGGGMSGGNSGTGGGGGGGGFASTTVTSTSVYGISAGNSLNINVGQGGSGASTVNVRGGNGGNSTVTSTIPDPSGTISVNLNALGGGGGASFNNINGASGASGGGGAYSNTTQGFGGTGTTGQGRDGGNSAVSGGTGAARSGGGGGGAGSNGEVGKAAGSGNTEGGNGGSGLAFSVGGTSIRYGAGGGGLGYNQNGNSSPGLGGFTNGIKTGGDGNLSGIGNQGQIYTGSGGGAGTAGGGNGGRGVVYVTYFNFSILPLDYLYFNATYNATNREVNLSWAVAKEWENSHFEVERSVNNINNWKKIGEVTGKGYSDAPVEYSFIDRELPASGGTIFYRLKQVNFSGSFFYSATKAIQVDPVPGASSWIIYPNPTFGVGFRLELVSKDPLLEGDVTATISTILGQTDKFNDPNIERLSEKLASYLQTKAAGVYILTLNWAGKTESFRIIKN
ncbi:MAG: PKD-like domain-containing protein [Algoriphagus aquaeductus]|uniref:glycine-rich domain-containing protein n=1 Tax=Algoriphagus aquaeductus TaxID=475299 RepID=UPI00391D6EA6